MFTFRNICIRFVMIFSSRTSIAINIGYRVSKQFFCEGEGFLLCPSNQNIGYAPIVQMTNKSFANNEKKYNAHYLHIIGYN